MYNLKFIKISKLKQHEKIDKENFRNVKTAIIKSGMLKCPIIVDKFSLTVLDGHHRLNSLKKLGAKKIPCILVDYFRDPKIRVSSRRKNYVITKEKVVEKALKGRLFPSKTTKHSVPYRIKNLNVSLTKLI